jgi:hypothetical protein
MTVEREYLTPNEALHALANGETLENDDGVELLLEGSLVVMRYAMGKNNTPVSQNYNGAFDRWFLGGDETEEANAP